MKLTKQEGSILGVMMATMASSLIDFIVSPLMQNFIGNCYIWKRIN